jgi:basic membrane protein A
MGNRVLRAASALAVAASLLAGCAENFASATPTPVDFKACLISQGTSFNDGAASQLAYYGLLQSQAQFGTPTSAVELTDGARASEIARAGRKLVSRGCRLVIGMGDNAASALAPLANGNPGVRFAALGYLTPLAEGSLQGQNLDPISFDSKVAYLQAGYLAAAKSATGKVAVVAASGDASVLNALWYFRQGVFLYREASGKTVGMVGAAQADPKTWTMLQLNATNNQVRRITRKFLAQGADVVMPLGVNGLVVAQQALAAGKLVIGTSSDWLSQSRFESVASAVLASVVLPISGAVADEVGRTMAANSSSAGFPTVTTYAASLTDEGSVRWGDGVANALSKLASDYASGKLTISPLP